VSAVSATARVLAIANQKGGVGKTTTAINLATALAACDKRILIIDIDPQANATTGLGVAKEELERSSYDVLVDEAPIEGALLATQVPNLWIVPGAVHLAGAELELAAAFGREHRLERALAELAGRFDYVLIDCPPSLNLLTVNALTAAAGVLVPLQCEYYALEGLSQLLKTIDLVRKNLNPHLQVEGVVLTMYDKRNNISDMVAADVRRHFGERVYDTVIPRNVRLSEAPSHGKPALLYDLRCVGSQAYIQLAGEMLRRAGNGTAAAMAMATQPEAEPELEAEAEPDPESQPEPTSEPESSAPAQMPPEEPVETPLELPPEQPIEIAPEQAPENPPDAPTELPPEMPSESAAASPADSATEPQSGDHMSKPES
jgi:chromosome partitioning protein